MSNIVKGAPSISELSDGEVDMIAGGVFSSQQLNATHQKICQIDANGDGWCFLKED